MKKLKHSILCAAACFCLNIMHAENYSAEPGVRALQQNGKVTGTVSDEDGPVAGAAVTVKGTTRGNVTDMDGRFTLEVKNGETLVVSFLGYVTREIVYGGETQLTVLLSEDTRALDEVVVTALGMSREKKALGYAMTEIRGDDIARVNVANPITGLQGRVAGVQIDMGNSGPQSSSRILIRGNSSLGMNNQPIFIIDGVIIDNDMNESTQMGAQMDFGNDIKNLNSDDFETVSILKGAAATALYGSRAANGVILITTRKGRAGEGVGVSVSHAMTWDRIYGFPNMQRRFGPGSNSAWELNVDGSTNRTTNTTRSFGPAFDGQPYTQGANTDNFIYQSMKNNVRQMYQTGMYMNTNAAVQGGDENGAFRVSCSHLGSNGITLNNDYKRNSISVNASRNVSRRLKMDAGVAWVHSDTKNPTMQGGDGSPIYDFMYRVPLTYDTKYWLKHYRNGAGSGYSEADPVGYTKYLFDLLDNNITQREDNIRGNMNADVRITGWMNIQLKGNINRLSKLREYRKLATGASNYDGAEYRTQKTDKEQYQLTGMISLHHTFGDFGLNGFATFEQYDTRSTYHETNSQGGLRRPGVFDMSNSVQPVTQTVRIGVDRKRLNSVYGAVNADWKGQVFVDVTGRNDWSSALIYSDGTGEVSYFYPSFTGSWILTETLRESLPRAISFAKIRASYAIAGNDCAPYLTGIGFYKLDSDNNTYVNPNDGKTYPKNVFDSEELRNLNLKPEKQRSLEFGTELKFVNNRIGLDFTWYRTNTKNQILALSMPVETGLSRRWINAGNIQNSGIEASLNLVPVETRDWRWDMTLNFTRNRNKIIELTEGVDKYEIQGGGLDMRAYATAGGGYADIYTSYVYKRNEKGELLVNPDGTWTRSGEQTKIGNGQPDFLAGMFTSLKYRSFSLSLLFDSRFGGQIVSGSYNYGMYTGVLKGSLKGRTAEYGGLERKYTDAYGHEITTHDGMLPEGVFAAGTAINGVDVSGRTYAYAYEQGLVKPVSASAYYNNKYSWGSGIREEAVKKISWIALREIALRWDMPKDMARRLYLQNINLGLAVRNVGYLYNSLPDRIHPEGLSSNRSYEFIEVGGAAYARTYGFNVNVTF
ncbi:MAG: SusC/RagA family TonB-linked outer membrane protein [Tannerella sp.]|jgi:iron complex outermembrane receptor protein|nr:SusC/RagA family TonB-linked outer membrane protein [Tannerella sp.]